MTTTTALPYFFYSSGILFREGLEALLVIIALAAGMRQAGQADRTRSIYIGALAALAMSLVLAGAVDYLIGDNTSDTLEGFFQLLAAATLFYVSSWMTGKNQARQWSNFIDAKVAAAKQSSGPSLALAATAFLAVMREGAETIVFMQALLSGATESAERHAVIAGLIAGAIALALTFLLLRRVTYAIPIGPVFKATSILLYAMAVIFVGQGIASFQESGVLSATFVNGVPTQPMLGLYPTVQTLAAQLVLLAFALVAILWPRIPSASVSSASQAA